MLTFNHFNFNVTDLDKSIQFYRDALGLEPVRRRKPKTAALSLCSWGTGRRIFVWS